MERRIHSLGSGTAAVLLLLCVLPRLGAQPGPQFDSANCRCVDTPLEVEGLPMTPAAQPPKRDKTYPPAWPPSKRSGLRRVTTTFFNVHSKEALPVLDRRVPPADVLDFFFRCRGFGTALHLDEKLVQTAVAAAVHFRSPRIEIISGYRSPKFNDTLSKKGRGVVPESKHTQGAALDFRVTTTEASTVAAWLFDNHDGGVGTYVPNNFVHIDTGPKRRWRGR